MAKKLFFIISICVLNLNLIAQTTYIPDDNFEQALIDLGYDSGALDDYVPTANISSIATLDISNKNILDLTGIEDFSALFVLDCSNNQLNSLDVSQNIFLMMLVCNNNLLTSIDLTYNTSLETLECSDNQLNNLNVTQNTSLTWLICDTNQLTSLDTSQNYSLDILSCKNNQISSLDLSQNTAIKIIDCINNQLNNLDLSQSVNLESLYCSNNQLTDLNLIQNVNLTIIKCANNLLTNLNVKNGNNINVTEFKTTSNPSLTCITVDDVAYSTTNWTEIDSHTGFSENCSLSINDNLLNEFILVYPNPAKNSFRINSELEIFKIKIYDNLGKLIIKYNKQESYDVSNLTEGVYFVSVESNKNMDKQKLIIKSEQ